MPEKNTVCIPKQLMQMLIRDGRSRPTAEQLEAQQKKQNEEDDREAMDFRQRMDIDRSIFSRD